MTTFENLIFEKSNGVATIKMNRPKAFNALNVGLGADLVRALEDCSDDDAVRAVILTGAGKAFCGGGDIAFFQKYLETDPSRPFKDLLPFLNRTIVHLRRMPKPVIAAINGAAGGAGVSLATACDLRICAASARFRQAYTGIGLVGDGAWMITVPLLIGFGKASELLFLDPVFDAHQALQWGLVNQVVEDAQLEKTTLDIAMKLSQGPAKAFAIAKENLNRAMTGLLETQLEIEGNGMIRASKTVDYQEGVKAFLEKRPPRYTGR